MGIIKRFKKSFRGAQEDSKDLKSFKGGPKELKEIYKGVQNGTRNLSERGKRGALGFVRKSL